MSKLFFLFSLIILLFSCQDKNKETHISQVDALIKTTDSIRTVFIENRNDSIMFYISKVMDVEFRIRRSYNPDTIDEVLGKKINDYKQIRKKLKPIIKNKEQLEKGTLEEISCLKKLKLDIENSVGDRSKYEEYIQFEKEKVNQLKLVLEQMITTQTKQIEVYNRLHYELYAFSMTLKHVI